MNRLRNRIKTLRWIRRIVLLAGVCLWIASPPTARTSTEGPFVAVMDMQMMILPGTAEFLDETIQSAADRGAKLIVIRLDTPGGMLNTTQGMIQSIFKSPVPIVVYVSPTGGTATSAGVFITVAAHVAAMAPGTSIGAATPIMGTGEDIGEDLKAKAENMTVAMVQSISEQRGRNVEWLEKAIREASSATEKEALELKVVDLVAKDLSTLLQEIDGKVVQVLDEDLTLEDYSKLPREVFEMSFRGRAVNLLANPNVAALLWLGATTGLAMELYNPGAIIPGVVGAICLILALMVSQIIPVSQAAILLLVVGGILIGAEFYVGSGILGAGGLVAMVLGALYLVDPTQAPGLAVDASFIAPIGVVFGILMLWVALRGSQTLKRKPDTGLEGMVGMHGVVMDPVSSSGRVFLNGEHWRACTPEGVIEKDVEVEVIGVQEGLVLEVKRKDA